jgi:hypothetical protein
MFATLATARPLPLRPALLPRMGLRRARGGAWELWTAPDGTPRYYVKGGRVWRFLDVVADC